uniref:Alkyl transferase n=1 Tax=Leucophyllum frutescens TaxID=86643 RepID=A0A7G6J4K3_LEUFR|nr:cis-prenyl transferase 2 [Leucophyllum frutescens]
MHISSKLPIASPLFVRTIPPSPHKINIKKPISPLKLYRPHSQSSFKFPSAAASIIQPDDRTSPPIQLPADLQPELVPKHVAIIMDGHRRWAKNRGLSVQHGYTTGSQKLKQLLLQCRRLGISVLTVFAFSTENWNRPKVEVDLLMSNYEDFIQSFVLEQIMGHGLRFSVIGDKSRLSQSLQSTVAASEELAKANRGLHFIMALSYSGRQDIVEASKKIANDAEQGKLRSTEISESMFEQQLSTNVTNLPNPDLLIRTSGELRVSNFMPWQLAYAEFYFAAGKMFPEFDDDDFIDALRSFQQRQRRYGGK